MWNRATVVRDLAAVAAVAGMVGAGMAIFREKSGPQTELVCPPGQVMVNYNLCVVGSRPVRREIERR